MRTTHTGASTASPDNIPAVRALVAVETAEKIASRAFSLLEQPTPDIDQAMALLALLAEETTTVTATLVKDQALSDEIARRVRSNYAGARRRAEAYAESKRAEIEAQRAERAALATVDLTPSPEALRILRTTLITTCPGLGCDWYSPDAEDEGALYRHLVDAHGLSHDEASRDSTLKRGGE